MPRRAALTSSHRPPLTIPDQKAVAEKFGALPLSFEPNVGQAAPAFDFVSHGPNYAVLLAADQATIDTQQQEIAQDPGLRKMNAKTLRKFERTKYFRSSPRFRKLRKLQRVTIGLSGANEHAKAEPFQQLPGQSSYFVGNDRSNWRTGISNYARVKYASIYPGIDLVYYGNRRQLEFDFLVSPGADPAAISLKLSAPDRVSINNDGDLLLARSKNSLFLRHPTIYQVANGRRQSVGGSYHLDSDGRVAITVGSYDKTKPLVIDPALAYSTYFGGSDYDEITGIAVDANGNAYLTGQTQSLNFPTANAYSTTGNSSGIAFVSKLDPTGSTLLYSTYLGGTGSEEGNGIALDASGGVYVAGYSTSTDFPIVNGFQTSLGTAQGNGFVARIDTTQSGTPSLIYSTYLGGGGNTVGGFGQGDTAAGIAVDPSGLTYVTGQTTSDTSVTPFPTTSTAYQTSLASTNGNAFLTVLDTNQSGSASLVYSTYLGGDGNGTYGFGDAGQSVAVDGSGDAYITGTTTSDSSGPFPITSGAYQSSLNSADGNAFVTEIATTQSGAASLVYSTYLGGSTTNEPGDAGLGVTLDPTGKVYVGGQATSSDFPTTSGAFQTTNSSPDGVAFAAKFDLTQSGSASLVYSTFLGGTDGWEGDFANGIAVDSNGEAFLTGEASSDDFPTTSGAYQTSSGSSGANAFVSQLNASGSALLYSTYFGGNCNIGGYSITLDSLANPYIVGATCDTNFPVYPTTTYQTSLGGNYDGYVTKFALTANPGIVASESPQPNANGWNNSAVTVSFTCVPGGAPISSCTSPDTLSTEDASQTVTGTAEDTASNTTSTTATVNIDLTAPSLSVTTPSTSSPTVSTPYIAISGTISDSLSGVGGVTCANAPAVVTGTSFSCTVPLFSASNTVVVTGFDVAGNTTTSTLSVTVSISAPTSLTVTPPTPNMVIGGTQAFTAIDQTGTLRPDATWSISDTSIASFVSGSPNILVGNAAGTATVTATIGTITGTTTVTVLSGSPSVGTVLWSAPTVSGYTTRQIVQAVPTANGPDLYSIDTDTSGDTLARAFKSDGEQLWQQSGPSGFAFGKGVGDNYGGVLLVGSADSGTIGAIVDFNPVTGAQIWTASSSESSFFDNNIALGLDGTVYAVDGYCVVSGSSAAACLDSINGSSGAVESQVELPVETYSSTCGSNYIQGLYTDPIVGPDGAVYMQAESFQYTATCGSELGSLTDTLYLLKNGAIYQTMATESGADVGPGWFFRPISTIPDGNGGILANYTAESSDHSSITPMIADTTSGGSSAFSNIDPGSDTTTQVLGDNNTAFITDGTNVVSFNPTTLAQNWTYTSTTGGNDLTLVNATPSGGVIINDSDPGVIQLDSSGSASAAVSSLAGAVPYDLDLWRVILSGVPAMIWSPDGSNGIMNQLAASTFPAPSGNPEGGAATPYCETKNANCVLAPIIDDLTAGPPASRDITYGVYSRQTSTLQPSINYASRAFHITLMEQPYPGGPALDSRSHICNSGYHNHGLDFCANDPTDDKDGMFMDTLSTQFGGVIELTQEYLIDRQQVQIFWPSGTYSDGSPWFGASTQEVIASTSHVSIRQLGNKSKGVTCAIGSLTRGCNTTTP